MRELQLSRSKVALVDDEDFERVSQHKWAATPARNTWYGVTNVKRSDGGPTTLSLHRLILRLPPGRVPEVDHVDGNGLNCRKQNMRLATHAQNMQNRRGAHRNSLTGVRGVSFDKKVGRYIARLCANRQRIFLGLYDTLAQAELAAIEGRRKYMTHSSECTEKTDFTANEAGLETGVALPC